jgi:hypothetical protein
VSTGPLADHSTVAPSLTTQVIMRPDNPIPHSPIPHSPTQVATPSQNPSQAATDLINQPCTAVPPSPILYLPSSTSSITQNQPESSTNPALPTHPMTTQAKNNITKPKTLTDGIVRYPLPHALIDTTISQEPKPTCYSSTMKNPLWRKSHEYGI